MQPNLENFKVTVIVSLFVLSLSFLVRHILNYPSIEQCQDQHNSSSLPCSYSITLTSLELLAAIFTTALSMLACCHDTRILGLVGFFVALVPAFLNFISPVYFMSSSANQNASKMEAMEQVSGYLQSLAIWLALGIGYFALYASPNLFKVPKKQKRRKNQSIVRITEQMEEQQPPHFYQKTDQESARESSRGAPLSSQRQFIKRDELQRTRSPTTASTSSTSSPSRRFLRQSKTQLTNLEKKVSLDELFS